MSCSCNRTSTPHAIWKSTTRRFRAIGFCLQIALNLEDSILDPSVGENQRFCHDVMAVGDDIPLYDYLSHLMLRICDKIPTEEIVNITVVINGVTQEVVFGVGEIFNCARQTDPILPQAVPA